MDEQDCSEGGEVTTLIHGPSSSLEWMSPSNRLKTFSSSPSYLFSSDVYPDGPDQGMQGRGEREAPPTGDTASGKGRVLAFSKTRPLCGCHQVSFHRHEICYLRGWFPNLNGILNLYERAGGSKGARPAPGSSTEEPSSYEEVNPILLSSVVFSSSSAH